MRARLIAVSLVLVLASACGASNAKKPIAITPTTEGTTSTTSAASATTAGGIATTAKTATTLSATNAAKLDPLLLNAADFPSDWTSSPPDTSASADDQQTEDELNACVGTSGREAEVARKTGNDFSQGQNFQAGSEASLVKDTATYQRDIAALRNGPRVSQCIKDAFTKRIQKDVPTLQSVEVSELTLPKHGDIVLGRRLTMTATANGQTVKIYLDVALMGKNRVEETITFLGFNTPFDAALQQRLVDNVGSRLDKV